MVVIFNANEIHRHFSPKHHILFEDVLNGLLHYTTLRSTSKITVYFTYSDQNVRFSTIFSRKIIHLFSKFWKFNELFIITILVELLKAKVSKIFCC